MVECEYLPGIKKLNLLMTFGKLSNSNNKNYNTISILLSKLLSPSSSILVLMLVPLLNEHIYGNPQCPSVLASFTLFFSSVLGYLELPCSDPWAAGAVNPLLWDPLQVFVFLMCTLMHLLSSCGSVCRPVATLAMRWGEGP